MKRTRVEDIARAAGIAKGTFYLFYESKEVLLFDLLERIETTERAPLVRKLRAEGRLRFEDLVVELVASLDRHPFLASVLRGEEIAYLFRKMPAEAIASHVGNDEVFIRDVCAEIRASRGLDGGEAADLYMKAVKSIFIAAFTPEMSGEGIAPALALLGRGLDKALEEEADGKRR